MNGAVGDSEDPATIPSSLHVDTTSQGATATMAQHSTVLTLHTACRHIFRTATTAPPLMQQERAENRLADFNLWSMGVGASSTGKASLDYRLHDSLEAHTILPNLLLMLRILIQKCIDGCMNAYHNRETFLYLTPRLRPRN